MTSKFFRLETPPDQRRKGSKLRGNRYEVVPPVRDARGHDSRYGMKNEKMEVIMLLNDKDIFLLILQLILGHIPN